MYSSRLAKVAITSSVVALMASAGATVFANHSWNGYHWARNTASFDLIVVNSTTPDWDGYVNSATTDWSSSPVLDMVEDATGSTSDRDRRQCRAPEGKVRICNSAYG